MAYVPKFLSRPFQGAAMVGNAMWNGRWNVPRWAIGSATENEEDLKALNAKPAQLNKKAIESIKRAYETLGLDYGKATSDPDYVEKAFKQVKGKMKAAGVDVDDDASIDAMAAAYAKMSDAQKKTYAEYDGSEAPQEDAPATARQPVSNGKQKATSQAAATGTAPIAPRRQQVPIQTDVTTDGKYSKTSASDTGVRANGAPVEAADTATKSAIKEAQRESARTDALQARRVRQRVQNDMQSDGRRLYQEHLANQDALDANMKARSDRLRKEREAAHKARMDKRYESRTLTGMADWENLGRDSAKRNFGARAEGESDESWNARSGAVDAVEKLRGRFAKLGVKDVDKNEFYAYNPNRMRDVSGLGNLFSKAVESGNLTDAQIDGINKTLDMYEGEASKTKATLQRNAAMRDAENVRKYREMYGMGDRDVFSDADVKKFHEDRQFKAREKILREMQVAPGQGGEEGRGQRIRDFADNWMKLVDNGLDVKETFKRAMSYKPDREAYQEGIASIASDDPERADKVDQLRRRFVLNQAMRDTGSYDKVLRPEDGQTLGAAMASDLPGKSGLRSDLQVAEDNALDAETKARMAGVSQDDIDAAKKSGAEAAAAPAADVLKPRKKEDTQQAAKGGTALRPRRRVR